MSRQKVVTETVVRDGYNTGARRMRSRSPMRATAKKKRSLFGRRKANVGTRKNTQWGLWRDEWDNCPPSGPECYYYVWNFTHDNYYCPEEDELLGRQMYSKYEIDDFLGDIKKKDLHRMDKNPTGWYHFLGAFIALGMGLILLGIYLWFVNTDNWRYLFLVLAIIMFIIATILIIMAAVYCCRGKRHRYLRRREDIMPAVDTENRRIYHRGLNWRLSELGSYLALRTNYRGPVGGYRRRNPHEEEALLFGEDPHSGAMRRKRRKLGSKKTVTETKIKKVPSTTTTSKVVSSRSRSRSPRASSNRVVEEVVEVRTPQMDVESISRSGAGFQESNYNTEINLNRGNQGLSNSQASFVSGKSSPRKYKNRA